MVPLSTVDDPTPSAPPVLVSDPVENLPYNPAFDTPPAYKPQPNITSYATSSLNNSASNIGPVVLDDGPQYHGPITDDIVPDANKGGGTDGGLPPPPSYDDVTTNPNSYSYNSGV